MNAREIRSRYLGLTLWLMLSACSGGNIDVEVNGTVVPTIPPIQTSEAITAHGVVTGLAGITVNDVGYTTNSAIVTINGQPGTVADLRLGQIATVSGSVNFGGRSGTADRIAVDARLVGPVESIDAPNGQLVVMGQTVTPDANTVFAAGIDPATFAGLSVGSIVEISGFADSAGVVRATRVDLAPAGAELQIIGQVAGLDGANLVFTINRLVVDYSNAMLVDLPGGAPRDGMQVKVVGTVSGGLFTVERLVGAPELTGPVGQRVQTAGVVTRFNSNADFDINGLVAFAHAGTVFLGGDSDDLVLNTEIVIDGDLASGNRITANRITFGRLVGNTTTLTFDYQDFNEIYVSTVFNVTVTQGPEFSVTVIVDEEAQDRIDVTRTGSRLNIALSAGNGNIETLEALVVMPALERIDLAGVIHASLNDFNQPRMTVNVGGVSLLQGHALTIGDLTANVSGVSKLDFGGIRPISNAEINIGGVSQATLNMDVGATMSGSVGTGQGTGVSTLFYYGTNVAVNVATDGLSSVVRLGDTRP